MNEKITISVAEIKEKYGDEKYIHAILNESKDVQEKEYWRLSSINSHLKFYWSHFQSRFFEECIFPFPSKGGTKELFENFVGRAEKLLSEVEAFLNQKIEIEVNSSDKYDFTPGKDRDLHILWGNQFHWNDHSTGESVLLNIYFYVFAFRSNLNHICNEIINDIKKPKEAPFWKYSIWARAIDHDTKIIDDDYEFLCSLLKEDFCTTYYQLFTVLYPHI